MIEAFYEYDRDGRYLASQFTRGPWDKDMQHGGPPAALVARALSDADAVDGQQLGRVTFEILRPIPIGPVRVRAQVPRPGKKVSMVTAVLTDDDDLELMVARGWRLQPTPEDLSATGSGDPPPVRPEPGEMAWFFDDPEPGFSKGVEVRFVTGSFVERGPGTAWFRMRIPLVAGQQPRTSDVLFVTADCGNGISAEIDFTRMLFINTDLNVSIERMPRGEWVCLQARTHVTPGGVTTAVGVLHDHLGRIARGFQTLYVGSR